MTLSGHLHGGIIGLPGIGGLITPQAVLFPKYAGGIYREGKHVWYRQPWTWNPYGESQDSVTRQNWCL